MDFELYTPRSQEIVGSSQELAIDLGHQYVTPEHLLKLCLNDDEELCSDLMQKAGGNLKVAREGIDLALQKLPKVCSSGSFSDHGRSRFSRETHAVFSTAESSARVAGDKYVGVDRIFIAIAMGSGSVAAKILTDSGITLEALDSVISASAKDRNLETRALKEPAECLRRFCNDLTEQAKNGKLDPVIGRDEDSSIISSNKK